MVQMTVAEAKSQCAPAFLMGEGLVRPWTYRGKPIAELVRALLAVNARSPTNARLIKSI